MSPIWSALAFSACSEPPAVEVPVPDPVEAPRPFVSPSPVVEVSWTPARPGRARVCRSLEGAVWTGCDGETTGSPPLRLEGWGGGHEAEHTFDGMSVVVEVDGCAPGTAPAVTGGAVEVVLSCP